MNAFDTEITKWLNADLGGFGALDWVMKLLASDQFWPALSHPVIHSSEKANGGFG